MFFSINVQWKTQGNGISENLILKIFLPLLTPCLYTCKISHMSQGIKFDLNQ